MQTLNNRCCQCMFVCMCVAVHCLIASYVVTHAGARSVVFAPIFTACSTIRTHTPLLSLFFFLVSRFTQPTAFHASTKALFWLQLISLISYSFTSLQ